MVERLRRLDRLFQDAPIYFVTACTHQRRKILTAAAVHQRLQEFAASGPLQGAWLGAYILMPDHLHAFVAIGDSGNDARAHVPLPLSTWMKSLKNALAKALRESGIEGPHWQKGYFDHLLRSEESYAEKWDYVRQNPVRAGLIGRAEDWPYFAEPFPLRQ
jgi:REP element-mobilizing transposase RayT